MAIMGMGGREMMRRRNDRWKKRKEKKRGQDRINWTHLIFSNASATLSATAGAKWMSATRGMSYLK
jgi:hypothetical protein